ncbi:cobalt-zinc-cadmium efflux system membrane fusion protein [Rhodopseudomonas thermotolerans]|uniref:Cobalt-zinc-cadmium efflux system membrane fusion protein n=2 Tax=Rhodopseudomonas TaxID=1073 RepID=A0A336JN86_9BRAD|nr:MULTISPECIES: efflux RND transporter periplasmic adaptor subunit [Rhodopseudomonas]RED37733.1 cobalt-zinc-cadmium efflux system membrane fusion protein [Rhodopseudomonas pentothenatexigens]REG04467.1 cobalt-zinc-cadmium efflux system membrane fusion protein [Rhodopseudomonas thermotolerans]SSW90233.1 cobalt-zinc-cadmium efflux system membrane fusion protein [Rhodopseudomonas pentothenatexigens]
MREQFLRTLRLRRTWPIAAACVVAVVATAGYELYQFARADRGHTEISSQSRRSADRYTPTPAEWASLTIEPVSDRSFRAEHVTEGKIAIDEDRATPVFSPYAGRVTRLLARPGDHVTKGQPLFTIEAPDTVQAQNEFIAASTSLNKAKSQLELAQLQDKRARDLMEAKAVPLKDYQQAQATLIAAQNDVQSATTALQAARNRLRILGLSEAAIAAFQDKGQINPETTIVAPIAGTVVQRKVGPGQYVNAGASDPVYMIGDLSTVWLTAFVRESEAAAVDEGQDVSFKVLALPGRTLTGRIDYVAAAIDPATRRLTVRATIDNPGGLLKPEMFANVTIYSPSDHPAVGVPRQALIYEGDQVRVWVAHDDRSIELRTVKPGLSAGDMVEVTGNLRPGEKVVTKGSLFIDRAATG